MRSLIIVSTVILALIVQQPLLVRAKYLDGHQHSDSNSVEHHHKTKHGHSHHHHKPNAPNMWTILGQTVKTAVHPQSSSDEPITHSPSAATEPHKHRHHHQHNDTAKAPPPTAAPTANCPKCRAHAANIIMTEEELTDLRITYVKNQILKKLKLTERPDVSLTGLPLPIPVAEGATMQLDDEDEPTGIPDDFYAKTNQKIIFPQLGELDLL